MWWNLLEIAAVIFWVLTGLLLTVRLWRILREDQNDSE